jgi:hypothetical protein
MSLKKGDKTHIHKLIMKNKIQIQTYDNPLSNE